MDAISRFEAGFNCSQAVFSAYAPQFGLAPELACRIAAPFGAGMGRQGEVCGAVTGALMVIGLKFGNATAQDQDAKEKTYSLVREFARLFQKRHGSILCRELLGCRVDTTEGLQTARDKNLFGTICPRLVQDAAEIVSELIE